MQIGVNGRLSGMNYTGAAEKTGRQSATEEWIQMLAEAEKQKADAKRDNVEAGQEGSIMTVKTSGELQAAGEKAGRAEAADIYEAAIAGKGNPISNMRQTSKVPYGYLAKDGVINYNGVCFVCDEKTNSICLGNMSNPKEVITVTLSGGGHLKVNRDNLGDLSKAAGMFSPEDLNLIMRAIAQDTKIQSMEQEIDDMERSVGGKTGAEGGEETTES